MKFTSSIYLSWVLPPSHKSHCIFFFVQSLLAALGSIQFVSNIAFAYFVFNKTVTIK